jgi:hypothetical protein
MGQLFKLKNTIPVLDGDTVTLHVTYNCDKTMNITSVFIIPNSDDIKSTDNIMYLCYNQSKNKDKCQLCEWRFKCYTSSEGK